MKIIILSWLLHHANRSYKCEHFYRVKNIILKKYGNVIDYTYQKMEGKKCWSCGGTGIWHGAFSSETCYKCYSGWYIRPHYNVLAIVKFGRYTFDQPLERIFKKPPIGSSIFEGYITHYETKFSKNARIILFILYDFKNYTLRVKQSIGRGKFMNPGFNLYRNISNLVYWYNHKYGKYSDLPF